MNNGVVIFGHNSKDIDYVKLANVSAKLVVANLKVPVTLITDSESLSTTVSTLKHIDNLVVLDRPATNNTRMLLGSITEFINTNRYVAYTHSPYDRTLLIDSDLLILSNKLGAYWESSQEFLITGGMNVLDGTLSDREKKLSPTTIPMRWATAIMFSKTNYVETIFKTVKYIQDNWFYFIDLYNMPPCNFRNDYAFTIANHIVNGFVPTDNFLPSPLMTLEHQSLETLSTDQAIIDGTVIQSDVHVMNKYSILGASVEY
jgi:hypothetical protein